MMILENETMTVLANLDWLIYHENARLDFAAGVVYGADGEPEYVLEDLATIGLTPATAPRVVSVPWDINPDALIGREVRITIPMAKANPENVEIATGCYRSGIGAMVHGPGCKHTP
jgi:hypothetical protein